MEGRERTQFEELLNVLFDVVSALDRISEASESKGVPLGGRVSPGEATRGEKG